MNKHGFDYILTTIMLSRGLSNKDVANKSGLPESTISKYRSGQQEPKFSQIRQIANGLNITLTDMMNLCNPSSANNIQPIFTRTVVLRPIFFDKNLNCGLWWSYFFEDILIEDIQQVFLPGLHYHSFTADGVVIREGKKLQHYADTLMHKPDDSIKHYALSIKQGSSFINIVYGQGLDFQEVLLRMEKYFSKK